MHKHCRFPRCAWEPQSKSKPFGRSYLFSPFHAFTTIWSILTDKLVNYGKLIQQPRQCLFPALQQRHTVQRHPWVISAGNCFSCLVSAHFRKRASGLAKQCYLLVLSKLYVHHRKACKKIEIDPQVKHRQVWPDFGWIMIMYDYGWSAGGHLKPLVIAISKYFIYCWLQFWLCLHRLRPSKV